MNANQGYFCNVGGSSGGFAVTIGNQNQYMNLHPDLGDMDWGDDFLLLLHNFRMP